MGVQINDLETDGIFKMVIDLQKAFDPEVEDEKVYWDRYDGAAVTIRELTPKETSALADDPNAFVDKLKDIIVDHTFEKKDGGKADPQAVAALIGRSSTLFGYVSQEITQRLPLLRKNAAKFATSQGS